VIVLEVLELAALLYLIRKVVKMSAAFDRLVASVAQVNTKADSLIALVAGLAQLLRDSAGDPAAITALADQLDAQSAEIQAAIDSNTPPTP
jgi:uncharacterized membrane protein affecting hemolysin expression